MPDIRHIGISLTRTGGFSQLHELETDLEAYRQLGFPLVEIDPTPFNLIVNGELRRPQLANFGAVLKNFDLQYSMHGLSRLNLAYDRRHELCQRIMACQIEICRVMGASQLVYHSGLQALDTVRSELGRSLLSDEELVEGAQREVKAFRDLAPLAADAGVTIGMENGDPHLWEYRLLERFGRPREELAKHHPRLMVGPIVQQLEAIDHPNVGMTMDIAHLHIAAHELGFDYLGAVRQAAPWVCHLHVNDNFGILDRGFDTESDRWAFGEADIHLPPGWGAIPFRAVLDCLPDYAGDLILEIKPGFRDYFGEGLARMQRLLDELE